MPISADQRQEILKRLRAGQSDSAKIGAAIGVPKMAVAAVKAWQTMKGRESATSTEEVVDEQVEDAVEASFGLERDLQQALLKNITQLEDGLTVSAGGKEHSVPSGRIDILAKDARHTRVVIELKAGTADRDAVAQILSYMGDLLTEANTPLRGILVAADFTDRAVAAARAVPNLELMSYSFNFSFRKVGA